MRMFSKFFYATILLVLAGTFPAELYGQTVVKQRPAVPAGFEIGAVEKALYEMINAYRQQNNLRAIPLSKSLSYVATLHAKDLYLNHPDQGPCNFHSWSDKGFWIPFCYPKDENKKNSVWDKPRELTKYPSKAYEIVYWENNPLEKDTIIMVWKTEEYFNNFLLNSGKWQGRQWQAIGLAVYENYACAWFGEDPDPEIIAKDTQPEAIVAKTPEKVPVITNQPRTVQDTAVPVYHIIVKTNLSAEASAKFVETLKQAGYPDARVLGKDTKLRISAFESPDRVKATARLKEVKKVYKDAWLLKQ